MKYKQNQQNRIPQLTTSEDEYLSHTQISSSSNSTAHNAVHSQTDSYHWSMMACFSDAMLHKGGQRTTSQFIETAENIVQQT